MDERKKQASGVPFFRSFLGKQERTNIDFLPDSGRINYQRPQKVFCLLRIETSSGSISA